MYYKPLAFHAAFSIAVVVTKGLYIILSVRFVICTFIMSLGILAVTVTLFANFSPFPSRFIFYLERALLNSKRLF